MGSAMAANLARAGFRSRAMTSSPSGAESTHLEIEAGGHHFVPRRRGIARGCDELRHKGASLETRTLTDRRDKVAASEPRQEGITLLTARSRHRRPARDKGPWVYASGRPDERS